MRGSRWSEEGASGGGGGRAEWTSRGGDGSAVMARRLRQDGCGEAAMAPCRGEAMGQ